MKLSLGLADIGGIDRYENYFVVDLATVGDIGGGFSARSRLASTDDPERIEISLLPATVR